MNEAGEVFEEMTSVQGHVETCLLSQLYLPRELQADLKSVTDSRKNAIFFPCQTKNFSNLLFSYCLLKCFFFSSFLEKGRRTGEGKGRGGRGREEGRKGERGGGVDSKKNIISTGYKSQFHICLSLNPSHTVAEQSLSGTGGGKGSCRMLHLCV